MLTHVSSIMRRPRVAAGSSYYDQVPTIIDGVPCIRELADADDLSRYHADELSADEVTRSRALADEFLSDEVTLVRDLPGASVDLARTYVVPDAASVVGATFLIDAPGADARTDNLLLFSTDCVTLNRDLADARTEVIAPVQRTSTFRDAPVDVSAYFKGQWEQEEALRRTIQARKSIIRPRAIVEYPIDAVVDPPAKATMIRNAKKTPRGTPRFLQQCPVCSLHPSTVTTVCGHSLCKMCAGKKRESAHSSWIVCPICRMAWQSIDIDPSECTVVKDTVTEDTVAESAVADTDWERMNNKVMEFEEVPKSAFKRTFSQNRNRSSLIGRMSIRVRKILK